MKWKLYGVMSMLALALGACGEAVVEETPPPQVIDADRDSDGIVDRLDSCSDLPGPKELNGCPVVMKPEIILVSTTEVLTWLQSTKSELCKPPGELAMTLQDFCKGRGYNYFRDGLEDGLCRGGIISDFPKFKSVICFDLIKQP